MQNTGPYSSPILNELHTHFPAFLYNEQQFQTIPDIFAYIRQQMHNRFDVYSTQRALAQPAQPVQPAQARQPAPAQSRQARRHRNRNVPLNPQVQSYFPTAQARNIIVREADPYSQLNRLLIAALGIPTVDFMDAVAIAPTTPQIEAGSTLNTATVDSPCAICQDTIRVSEIGRRLNHCGHTFHRTCIDTWYQRNVHCPVCRHDIRS